MSDEKYCIHPVVGFLSTNCAVHICVPDVEVLVTETYPKRSRLEDAASPTGNRKFDPFDNLFS